MPLGAARSERPLVSQPRAESEGASAPDNGSQWRGRLESSYGVASLATHGVHGLASTATECLPASASTVQGACTLSSLKAMHSAHETLDVGRIVSRVAPNGCRMVVRAAGTQKGGVNPVKSGTNQPGTLQGGGSRYVGGKKVKAIEVFGDKSGKVRDKIRESPEAIKILSRVEQLRLLSKAEKAGLLTTVENLGFSLSKIESLGLLSKAEELGVLSAATNPATPGALLTTALALLLLGPVFVYFVPETSTPLIVLQVIIAAISVVGGSAAFGASNFVSTLQNSE